MIAASSPHLLTSYCLSGIFLEAAAIASPQYMQGGSRLGEVDDEDCGDASRCGKEGEYKDAGGVLGAPGSKRERQQMRAAQLVMEG